MIEAWIGGMDLTTTIEGQPLRRAARELRNDLDAVRQILVPVRSPLGRESLRSLWPNWHGSGSAPGR